MVISQAQRLKVERWARMEAIFQAAAELMPDQSPAFLDEACASDIELRDEVEGLLRVKRASGGFIDSAIRAAIDSLPTLTLGTSGPQTQFSGTERFELRRRLGSGGFGTVHEAYDHEQDAVIALKTMLRTGGWEIYFLKREFRSLAGIAHPNLVSMYELLSDGLHWFFTMELVDGTSFLEFVRDEGRCDFAKLRSALAQLAEGVRALHESGKLHRDLKPSNVLVTAQGRVVILDFGLVADALVDDLAGERIAGTPPYMAPEQLNGSRALPASDWFAVGVMLFEALTGTLPFGEGLRQIAERQRAGPPPLRRFDPLIPQDLELLCRHLLQYEAADRPAGPDLPRRAPPARVGQTVLVGRERHMAMLHDALRTVEAGASTMVALYGDPGAGKTALAQHFLRKIRRERNIVAFSGRCCEQESVPYSAFDGIVDDIAAHLRGGRLPEAMSREIALAGRLFPVLKELISVRTAPVDSHELRQAAIDAFRGFLTRLAEPTPLVIHIDDLHWANSDSLQLLAELLKSGGVPRMLLMVSFRSESREELEPIVRSALHLEVEPLPLAEARELAARILPSEMANYEEALDEISRESDGNPLLLNELAWHARSGAWPTTSSGRTLDRMLERRFSDLSVPARKLLDTVAVAGRPIEWHVVRKVVRHFAPGHGPQENELLVLRAQHLVRTRRVQGRKVVESAHDSVREAARQRLAPKVIAQIHLNLGHELESAGNATPDRLAVHFHEGGNQEKAFRYSIAAAEQASKALAFEGAIRHYRLALELHPEATTTHEIRERLAEALGNAGRGAEAAALYLDCAQASRGPQALELRRRAAAELLISGRIQQGLESLDSVLNALGMKLPRSALRALPALLLRRAWLRIRRIRIRVKSGARPEALARIDACWTVAQGLAMTDTIRAAEFHARHLMLSLKAGDPYRIARALAIEVGYLAIPGARNRKEIERLLHIARQLAQTSGSSHAAGLVSLAEGFAEILAGRWKAAAGLLSAAEIFLRERCTGIAWELATTRLTLCVSLFCLGEIKQLTMRCQVLLENAEARGDLYESTDLKIRIAHVTHLAEDRPDAARDELAAAIARWPAHQFYLQHWWAMIAGNEIALYENDVEGAWRILDSKWGALRRSLLMRVQYVRIESLFHRAVTALALAHQSRNSRERARLTRIAHSNAKRIAREKTVWGDPIALAIQAGAAMIDRNEVASLWHLRAAEEAFRSADMQCYAAIARRRRGQLTGGDDGDTLIREAEDWMASQEIRNPDKMSRILFASGI